MAAENHLINYDSAVKGLNATFKTHVSQLSEVVSKYVDLNGQLSKLPSEYISNLNQMHQAQEKVKTSTENVVNSTKKLNTAVQQRLTTGASLYKQQQKEIIATERQTKAEEKLSNTYNKVQAKINSMSQTYNNIATRKQLGLKLTIQEEAQLLSLERRLLKYNDVLKAVDAQVGKHQRNVGNYKSGFDGLGNSINQITREMPAFAVSAQVGFLALSNNIPILADEIQRLSRNVAEMRAQGKQVPGVMSQILSSFLGWQTLLSIGVTLVTIYGKEIGQFIAEVFQGSKKIDQATISQNAYNEALKSGEYQKVYTDIRKVGIAFEQAKNGTISKKEALKEYNDTLGEVMGKTNDFNVAEQRYIDNSDRYIAATLAMASANHLFAKSAELNAQKIELQTSKISTWDKVVSTLGSFGNASRQNINATVLAMADRGQQVAKLNEEMEANEKAIKSFFDEYRKQSEGLNLNGEKSEKAISYVKDRITAEYELQKVRLDRQIQEAKFAEDDEVYYQKQIDLAQLTYDYQQQISKLEIKDKQTLNTTLLKLQEEYLSAVESISRDELKAIQDKNDKLDKERYDQIQKQVEFYKKLKDLATKARQDQFTLADIELESQQLDTRKGSKSYNDLERERIEEWWKLQRDTLEKGSNEYKIAEAEYRLRIKSLNKSIEDELINGMKSILEGSFSNMGFGSLSAFFDDQLANMWENTESTTAKMAIAFQVFGQIANDVFAKLKASSDAYYENQFNLLEKEKETAIKYAGENTEGREAIEEQYNQRRLQLKRQQARQEKNMAIFQALINVATGVTSALAQAPPYSFILAALVGALGAAQIATISSQPLPQFYKGTQNAPEGWAIVDELRPEVHTDKHGNLKSTGSDKGANLRYLEKGDKIFKSHSDFFREMSPSYVDRNGNIHIENNGISKSDMRDVLKETLGSQTKEQTVIDEHGFNHFVINGQNKVRKRNRRTKH